MNDMDQFYTTERAETGVKLPLSSPEGRETDHYLVLRGIDSKNFRATEARLKSQSLNIAAISDDRERASVHLKQRVALSASLVKAWSFDLDCTLENIERFLIQAPQILDEIDRFTGNRALFTLESMNSTDSPSNSTDSKSPKEKQEKSDEPS